MDAQNLDAAIKAVCPIIGVRVGKELDRATWSFVAAPEATAPQIAAANNVLATIPTVLLNIVPVSDFIQRWLPAEYLALMRGRATAITNGNIALVQLWDVAMALDAVDLNTPKAQQFKSAIVAAGILTQARADEIFS